MSVTDINVLKRNGELEPLTLDKIHRVLEWAASDLEVSISQVEISAQIQFYDGITTKTIHDTLVKAAADLITAETPDYQYLAARLAMFDIRKMAYDNFIPPSLYDHVVSMTARGLYDEHILEDYTQEELDQIEEFVVHERDMMFSHAAISQFTGKYLVQDRTSGRIFESPQYLYVLIAACLFSKYSKETRLGYIKQFYEGVSTFKFSLPTPIMGGVRTPTRQFSSCVLVDCGDTLDSINATTSAVVKYISQRAGIGINGGAIRAMGEPIRGGEASHTGVIPFYKMFQAAVKSCSQGGIRGGSATLFYPIWHREIESMLVLRNNRGVEENRVRHLDYGVQINGLMYRRLRNNESITLFSPNERSVPGLYEAYFADQAEFERLYLKYEADDSIRKTSIPAVELFSLLMQERASTGRIYVMNVDNVNKQGPFLPEVAPIRQSNLCLEIALPTKPLTNINDEEGEIALCTLSAFNLGAINGVGELKGIAEIVVRALDALLSYQDYPVIAGKNGAMKRRSLGIGVINYAYYLAKNGVRYSDGSANDLTHKTFEAIQYYLLKASNKLAKEFGVCEAYEETKYAQGLLPIDTYNKRVDTLVDVDLQLDWESLRKDIAEHGLRNSTLTSLMPSETSSQISNATNGIEPPRGLVSVKQSKDGILRQVVPGIRELGDKYELLWDIKDNKGYLALNAIMQKFVDQAISTNTSYNPAIYPDGKVPMNVLLGDMMWFYAHGGKTLYYHNTHDGSGMDVLIQDDGCESGACKI